VRGAALLGLLVFGLGALGSCVQRKAHADCGGPTDCRPALKLATLDGGALGDEALGGQVVLVNFWATWCAPCQREIPALQAAYERHRADGFTILGVVAGDPASDGEVKDFAVRRGVGYPLVRSTPDLERRFAMDDALPTSYLYDRGGRLVRRWRGGIEEGALEDLVKTALASR